MVIGKPINQLVRLQLFRQFRCCLPLELLDHETDRPPELGEHFPLESAQGLPRLPFE